jgi:hypothetical protein
LPKFATLSFLYADFRSRQVSEVPEVAFTKPAPLEAAFVTVASGSDTIARSARALPETDALEFNARLERRQDIKEAHGHAYGPGPIEPRK